MHGSLLPPIHAELLGGRTSQHGPSRYLPTLLDAAGQFAFCVVAASPLSSPPATPLTHPPISLLSTYPQAPSVPSFPIIGCYNPLLAWQHGARAGALLQLAGVHCCVMGRGMDTVCHVSAVMLCRLLAA